MSQEKAPAVDVTARVAVALERIATPFLSDVLTFCYALYYFHPIILGGLLFADDRREDSVSEPKARTAVRSDDTNGGGDDEIPF